MMPAGAADGRRLACAAVLVTMTALLVPDPVVGQPVVPVDIRIDARHEIHRSRLADAAAEVLVRYAAWLGAPPFSVLIVTDASSAAAPSGQAATLLVDIPWRSPARMMELEAQVAFELARLWIARLGDDPSHPVRDGLAWYLQSRVVEEMFDRRFLATAHSVEGARFFGGAVPWSFPSLRLSRWSAGLGRALYLADSPGATPPLVRSAHPSAVDARVARGALAFGTVERLIGWPALQGAIKASLQDTEVQTGDALLASLGAAAGRDLAWFFDRALDPAVEFDYAVRRLESVPCPDRPCFSTSVEVVRTGTGVFSGTASEPEGPYEAGDALELRVGFDDGQEVRARWDGRADRHVFEFESPSPAHEASLDPEGVLLLDRDLSDNVRAVRPRSNVPVAKWVATWIVWLQDAMLLYGALF